MAKREEAKEIYLGNYETGQFKIEKNSEMQNVILKQKYVIEDSNIELKEDIKNVSENDKLWASISSDSTSSNIDETLGDYKTRTELIDKIIKEVIENDINGLCIEFNNISDTNSMARFMIELTPKLREIGVSTSLVLKDGMNQDDYKNIVDYIVK